MTPPKNASSRKRRLTAANDRSESYGSRKSGYRSLKRAPPPARLSLEKQLPAINYGNITLTPQITTFTNQSFGFDIETIACDGPCCTTTTTPLDLSAWLEGLPIECADACGSAEMGTIMTTYPSSTSQAPANRPAAAAVAPSHESQFFCQAPGLACAPPNYNTIVSCSPPSLTPVSQSISTLADSRPFPLQSTPQQHQQSYDEQAALRRGGLPLGGNGAGRQTTSSATTTTTTAAGAAVASFAGLPTPVTPTFPALLPSSFSDQQQPHKPAPWETEPCCFPACAIGIEHEALELSLKILQQWHPIVMQSQRPDLLQQLWDTENSVSKFAAMLFELRMQDWDKR
ncbi:hypothetical protein B0J12DRAFT_648226 [Macrophomina phaseolina]|uniref:Uncharacterized protein n=1 Tax=Macrophomina phaseolina TaxID=35725 RepID=A0ABQ8GP38_9PEZI|nr:hypothetical protein B0J12DRAFT_648226 [Macrophomina phaseolina]